MRKKLLIIFLSIGVICLLGFILNEVVGLDIYLDKAILSIFKILMNNPLVWAIYIVCFILLYLCLSVEFSKNLVLFVSSLAVLLIFSITYSKFFYMPKLIQEIDGNSNFSIINNSITIPKWKIRVYEELKGVKLLEEKNPEAI